MINIKISWISFKDWTLKERATLKEFAPSFFKSDLQWGKQRFIYPKSQPNHGDESIYSPSGHLYSASMHSVPKTGKHIEMYLY